MLQLQSAAKINARSDFSFSAGVDANGDLQLTAGANAGELDTNTVTLNLYAWAADSVVNKTDIGTGNAAGANITGAAESSTDIQLQSNLIDNNIGNGNVTIGATHEMTDVVSSINNATLVI